MVRRKGTTLRTSSKILADFPVARWRGGGRHLPVTSTLHFRRFQFCQPKPSHLWPQWKCRLLGERLAQQGPDTQAFITDVTERLHTLSTFSPTQVNRILMDAGQQHFRISRPSGLQPPWQDAQHVGTIRDMWTQFKTLNDSSSFVPQVYGLAFRSWRCHTRFQAMHRTFVETAEPYAGTDSTYYCDKPRLRTIMGVLIAYSPCCASMYRGNLEPGLS